MTVRSLADWVLLPELGCPAISRETRKGAVYAVHKVGLLAIPEVDMPAGKVPGVMFESGKCLLPTIELAFGNEKKLCKLPLQLSAWAVDIIALTEQLGESPFPAEVEFGILNGRHYAEIL